MVEGNLAEGIEAKFNAVVEIEAAYSELRQRGLDLYIVNGDRMMAFPDAKRETLGDCGEVVMNHDDWKAYSIQVNAGGIMYEISQKDSLLNRLKTYEEFIIQGIRNAKIQLERAAESGKIMSPIKTYSHLKLFSAKSIREAMQGNAPKVDYDDIHMH